MNYNSGFARNLRGLAMSSKEWKKVKLSEIAHLNYGKSLTSGIRKIGKVPVYSSSGITGWHDTALVNEDGIVIGRKGNVGSIFYADGPFYCIDTAYYIKKSELKCNIKYFYYLLKTLGLEKLNEDSAVPGLNRDTAHSQQFLYPEKIDAQNRIAEILSALDDKIELNRQTNATLEAIAQAIFKEWFVDFDFPGATGELVESELGMIPKGWKVGRMGDFGDIVCGKTPSKTNENFFGGNIPFIKIPDMHNSVFIVETSDTLTLEGGLSQKNKFLPPNSIIVSCIATIGLVSLTAERSQTNQQINAIIPKKDFLTHYIYFTARNIKEQLMELGSGGSATLNVNTSSFSNIKCVIPSEYVLSNFNFLVKPLFEGILANQQEMLTIAKCRDEFLPKLMNGEIDV